MGWLKRRKQRKEASERRQRQFEDDMRWLLENVRLLRGQLDEFCKDHAYVLMQMEVWKEAKRVKAKTTSNKQIL